MKYKIEDRKFLVGKKCLIIATREIPYNSNGGPYNIKEVYPKDGYDYLVSELKKIENGTAEYLGMFHVKEEQIEDRNW